MSNSAEEFDLIRTILGYCDTGATHMEPEIVRNPVAHYTDPDRLAQEVNVLFREFPIIVGHLQQVAEPGDYLTHDATGVPMLVTRTQEGEIKAFVNVCRHRGARVVNEPCGHANTFSCPYHSWTYDLNGTLRGMPQPIGFDGLDKTAHNLVELPAFERFGLIWVRPSVSDKAIDIDAWLRPMAEQLGSLNLEAHKIHRQWSIGRDMSWRIALEGFQESYHFCSAHKHTACSSYLNNQSVFLDKYPHIRHAVPLSQITALKNEPEDSWDYRQNFMTQNFLFPCNFIQVMTDHVYVHTIIPTGPGTCVFQCMMLIPQASAKDGKGDSDAEAEKQTRYWEANYNVVKKVFDEDFEIGENIQRGLATGVNDAFVFGRYEAGLQLAQKAMDDALTGRLKA